MFPGQQCVLLRPPKNGEVDCTNTNYYGSTCTISCNIGYEAIGDLLDVGRIQRTCDGNEEWTGTSPSCQCKFHFHQLNISFKVIKRNRSEDQEIHKSSSQLLTVISCPELPILRNGRMQCTDRRTFASICQFQCNEGYQLNGSPERMCRENRDWSGVTTSCDCKFCDCK